MNGNTPYAGNPSVAQAGRRAESDLPSLSSEDTKQLHRDITAIADATRQYLPDEYLIDVNVAHSAGGPEATVAVQPPVGSPVSAGFSPNSDDLAETPIIDPADREEVAQGLAASAALQVKRALNGSVTPAAQ